MKVVIDIEANRLINPDKIWLIVCKDTETNNLYIFRNVTNDEEEKNKFLRFTKGVSLWIGHNFLGFDYPVLSSVLKYNVEDIADATCDTLILSKLIDYPRKGHSVEDYGIEFGYPKGDFSKWDDPSLEDENSPLFKELEEYCIRDVSITHKIYLKYLKYYLKEEHKASISLEHKFQLIVNDLSTNGFSFNTTKANNLLDKVTNELKILDDKILKEYPKRLRLVREITPKVTKHGTLSRTDFRWVADGDLSEFNGGPFCRCEWVPFNPSSHKQLVDVLNKAGWVPTDKTQTHIDTEREINRQKHSREAGSSFDLDALSAKLLILKKEGWKINETNLSTLPDTAPPSASSLAKRILLEARRRTLTEWLGLVDPSTNRIHGKFYGIGAWTHRMAHQAPNTANIPNEFDTEGKVKLLGKEMRSLWQAPRNRLLVGVDAEGIQLRIFAHYIDDPEFTDALVKGKKDDKTDPHSLNQRILGSHCKTRAAAKRFIYALLLGGGIDKLSQILSCSKTEAEEALSRLIERYEGFARLKRDVIPLDGKRGYFIGLDGRKVRIPGETVSERKHLAMSGYLQNGEAVVMKLATTLWYEKLKEMEKIYPRFSWKLVNFVHDEWQTEVNNNMELALLVASSQADALRSVGEALNLKCPLAGSYWNDDHHDYTIGTSWYRTH